MGMRPIVFVTAAGSAGETSYDRLRACGRAGLALRPGLERGLALRGVVRDFNFAEVEGHAGDALRDAVRRWQAAQIRSGFQGAGLDHRVSRSLRWDGMVTTAGAMIIARNTSARTRSKTMATCSFAAGLVASKIMIGWINGRENSTGGL